MLYDVHDSWCAPAQPSSSPSRMVAPCSCGPNQISTCVDPPVANVRVELTVWKKNSLCQNTRMLRLRPGRR
jgi:hypothetical protein